MSQPPGYPTQPSDPPGQPLDPYAQPTDPFQPAAPGRQPAASQPPAPPYGFPAGQPAPYSVPGAADNPYGPPPQDAMSGWHQGQPPAPAGFGQPSAPPFPPAGGPFGQPGYPQPGFEQPGYAQPGFGPQGYDQPGYGQEPWGAPPARKSRVALLTAIIVSVLVVVVGGGVGGYLIFGRSEGDGLATPEKAADGFLTAVLKQKDIAQAEKLVCSSARDTKALRERVNDLRAFELKYKSPSYSWQTPTVESKAKESATVMVEIKMQTSDDKVSSQRLKILTIKGTGWLVCEIGPAS